ncbi:hypothetical protein TRFO_37559 [Tritrichomonas foetus]|uniref:DDE-1 domain-containing protein n=1 Tax=Tritrichomonas foetus TaxID=1144522 RepID=A0A1J4JAT4_9EUKA|nr:hypothetical protein TRFO_37559 [Tritrichomonas foetus]|eukprot:OHS96286.1 hypothetical protein TRFO_37559 [Tritrichomonas foetus]
MTRKYADSLSIDDLARAAHELLGPRYASTLKGHNELRNCDHRYQQISQIFEIFNNFEDIISAKRHVITLFGISRKIFSRSLQQSQKDMKKDGRPKILTSDQENAIINQIRTNAVSSHPLSQCEVLDFALENFEIALSYSWLHSFIKRHKSEVIKATASPQDSARLLIRPSTITDYIDILKKEVAGICMDLIYNFDEMGTSERHESKVKDVLIPADMKGQTIHYSIKRNQKNITLVACINGGGDTVMPLIVDHRLKIQPEVTSSGLRLDEDVMIRSSESGFVNEELIIEWLNKSAFKHINASRECLNDMDLPAIMFSDNCSAHTTERIKQIFAENLVKLITFPSNSTGLFQMLDLVTFGILKRRKKGIKTEFKQNSQADIINKLIQAFEQATTGNTNRKAFSRAGIRPSTTKYPYVAIIDEKVLLESKSVKEIFKKFEDSELPEANNKTVEFGFINKEYYEIEFQKRQIAREKARMKKSTCMKYRIKPKIPKLDKK